MEPLFSPALHLQRHQFVIDFVRKNKPKKVADLGCGECSLLKRLKFHRDIIELLVGVDVRGAKIKKNGHSLAPLSTDYLQPGHLQLRIELYEGSVTQRDSRLRGFDLVTCMELIEHLPLADVDRFSQVVFGYMRPLSVIVSTPNSDYNPLLPGLRGFRHSDHKFEWSRAEFQSWALGVCSRYGFAVEFSGVGRGPQESVGFCSQIGVFHRIGGSGGQAEEGDVLTYTLLYSVRYPSLRDNNTLRKAVVSEALYWAQKLAEPEPGDEGPAGDDRRRAGQRGVAKAGGGEEQGSSSFPMRPSVPLDVLWSNCPTVSQLSGSLRNLRIMLLDDPQVKLSQDGSALLLHNRDAERDEEEEEEEELSRVEDSGFAEPCDGEEDEDWEAEARNTRL